MRERTTRYVLLGALASRGAMTGYDLRRWVETRLAGFWSESFGQIYPELHALSAEGLVASAREGKGEGKPYRITASGRAALAAWLAQPARAERPRSEIQLKLTFGRHFGADTARALLEAARDGAAERLDKARAAVAEARTASGPTEEDRLFGLLALDRSRALAEAELAWAERSLAVVDALEADGPPAALERLSGG